MRNDGEIWYIVYKLLLWCETQRIEYIKVERVLKKLTNKRTLHTIDRTFLSILNMVVL